VRGACGVSGVLAPPRPARPWGHAAQASTSVSAKSEAVLMRDILYGVTTIRRASSADADPIWGILEPVIRAGETYTLPRDMTRDAALAYWFAADHEVFVAEDDGDVVGTYYLRPNQKGGGAHVANCGYMTAAHATGRGIARSMCAHSLEHARARGFKSMQFNFVVSTNERAVKLWEHLGFRVIGILPEAFLHPARGYVNSFVMYRSL
jgi:L-amino acid N-acyltransferase YncA